MMSIGELKAQIDGVRGFTVAGVSSGLKKDGQLDFALLSSDRPCTVAGVFTENRVKAAPVILDMARLEHHAGEIHAVVMNSGGANACTGQQGIQNAETMTRQVAERLRCDENAVLVLSTGVIGQQLDMEKVAHGVEKSVAALGHDWKTTAQAIMTTDTRPKLASVTVTTDDGDYTVAGIAKGSGMIAPNMATMLAIIVTDASVNQQQNNRVLKTATDHSFNRIVVDGDMSTNDTVLLLANGASGVRLKTSQHQEAFQKAVTMVCQKLAHDIVLDGEGATKFITISVHGAPTDADANRIAHAIATSPLVKTAFYGNDANWGRIIAAAGRAGVSLDADKLALWISPRQEVTDLSGDALLMVRNGTPTNYNESRATEIISSESVFVLLTCGMGDGWTTVWTCDLSHEYVSINADYRT